MEVIDYQKARHCKIHNW